ncbi:hypothetical protein HDU78_002336 [Chytriomyces hyalinus]|nr:hypothetical protein HDU78_002336 [Chytriomyces hyalinus]
MSSECSPQMSRFMCIGLACSVALLLNWLVLLNVPASNPIHLLKKAPEASFCDPYKATAGYVDKDTGVFHSLSVTGVMDPNPKASQCPTAGTDNFGALAEAAKTKNAFTTLLPVHMRNKFVLLYGDSFERNMVVNLCDGFGIPSMGVNMNGSFVESPIYGDQRICVIRSGGYFFAAISVFHYGITGFTDPLGISEGYHWEEGYSPIESQERISWLPHFLRSVASRAFPELCKLANEKCPDPVMRTVKLDKPNITDSTPPKLSDGPFWFPAPSLIMAQSVLWSFQRTPVADPLDHFTEWAKDFIPGVKARTFDPMYLTFQNVVKNVHLPDSSVFHRFYTRTMPFPGETSKWFRPEFSAINWVNRMIRNCLFCETDVTGVVENAWGVLDWEPLVSHTDVHAGEDATHPGKIAERAYWQLLLSRLEILHALESS